MLKFDVGEHYILCKRLKTTFNTKPGDVIICSDSSSCSSEFYSISGNEKFTVSRLEYGWIHDLIMNNQFKDKLFVFDSSLEFAIPIYHKLVEFGGGTSTTTMVKKVDYFITNASVRYTTLNRAAKSHKIKKLPEKDFWKLYYK